MIIRSKKGTNEKFAIQNEIQNLKNFYRKIKDSLRNTYKNWKNRYGRSYQGKDVTRSTMFWTAEKQFFPETLGKIYTHPTCFVRFILLANYKDSSSNTADSIEQYSDGIMQDSTSRVIARKLRDLRDVDTVSTNDRGSTVYAHMGMTGEELCFDTNQDYVMAYVKIPVSGKVFRTEEDVDEVLSDVMDILSKV